jgi:hypothetical protein
VSRLRKNQLSESEGYKELSYDLAGRVTGVTLRTKIAGFLLWRKILAYDAEGRLEQVVTEYPDGTVTKLLTYDAGTLKVVES